MRFRVHPTPLLTLTLALAGQAVAGGNVITGYNQLRLNTYHSAGDTSASPYRYSGGQYENNFSLSARNRISANELLDLGVDATLNHSQYRDPNDYGLDIDRLRLNWEKGDTALPYRLEAGDVYIGFGQLSAETTLKGVQIDLQPHASGEQRDSVQIFAGNRQSQWDEIDLTDDAGFGASWLRDYGDLGALSTSFVYNHRQGDAAASTFDRDQQTLSLAWVRNFSTTHLQSSLEGEYSLFHGGHDASAGQNRHDQGGYLEWRGDLATLPLDYRLRLSRNGEDFRPAWSSASADQQNGELHLGWQLPSRHRLRLRALNLRDAISSGDPTRTRTLGLNLSGDIAGGFVGSLDAYTSAVRNTSRGRDSRGDSLRLGASGALAAGVYLNSGLSWLQSDDHTAANSDSAARQLDLGLTFTVDANGWRGRVSPGVQLRRNAYANAANDVAALLNFSLAKGSHDLSLALRRAERDYRLPATSDLDQNTLDARYNYRAGRHTLGLEYNRFERYPQAAGATRAWHLGATWSYDFEHIARRDALQERPHAAVSGGAGDLLDFIPGMAWSVAVTRLQASQPSFTSRDGERLLGGLALLAESELEQQLVLVDAHGEIESAHLLLTPRDSSPTAMQAALARLRSLLIKRYGIPAAALEKGAFDASLMPNLQTGEFVRVYQWQAGEHILRFGIPWRADGRLLFELSHTRQRDELSKRDWGLAY